MNQILDAHDDRNKRQVGRFHLGVQIAFVENGIREGWLKVQDAFPNHTVGEVTEFLNRLKSEGKTFIPTCRKVDERGVCRGHKVRVNE